MKEPAELDPLEQVEAAFAYIEQRAAEVPADNGTPETTEAAILALRDMAERMRETTRAIGLQAVRNGTMTRVELGRRLRKHPHTISRWLRASDAVEVEIPED